MEKPQQILDASSLVTNRLKAMNDLFIDPESVSSPALVNNIAHALSSQDKDHVIELSVGPSKFFTVNNITAAGCKSLLEYLTGEADLLNPEILCKNHKNLASLIMKECPNCALLNTSVEEMEHMLRYHELWDKVNLVANGDGTYKIVVPVPFNQPLHEIGKLENMNFKEAESAAKRLMDKAEKLQSLDIIHGQIRDKIFAKHLSIIPQEDIAKIEKGVIFANCVLRNLVFNLAWSSSPLRLVCNTASAIPFSNSSLTQTSRYVSKI